tara:strand:+ start:158 stop:421 length:264 start_codon:yes stop_codon:yes gene_type:complete
MPIKKKDATHIASEYSVGKKEVKLRKKRAQVRSKIGGINKVTGKKKNKHSLINRIRKAKVKSLTRRIKNQDMVPNASGRDTPLPKSK